jgi:hypothetical protein
MRDFKDKADILSFFVRGYEDFQNGTIAEPAYSQSARAVGAQNERTYDVAEEELRAEGIDISAVCS